MKLYKFVKENSLRTSTRDYSVVIIMAESKSDLSSILRKKEHQERKFNFFENNKFVKRNLKSSDFEECSDGEFVL